jgi:DNA polymerase-3 subunit delta'
MENRIKARKLLEQYESVPYQALERAMKGRGLSHAYLFHGPQGTLKSELALLLAQSLLSGHTDGLIHEEDCDEASQALLQRIAEGNCTDLIWLSGSEKKAIDKQSIDDLQETFARKPMECPCQVYVLEQCENSSSAAMNSILKFLEEPGEYVYAILTSDNVGRVLPTIRSRCVLLPFQSLPQDVSMKLAEEDGADPEDAYFMSRTAHLITGQADYAVSAVWQTARKMFRQFLGVDGDPRLLLVDYDLVYRSGAKKASEGSPSEKEEDIAVMNLFFSFLIMMCEDALTGSSEGPVWYYEAAQDQKRRRSLKDVLRIAIEQRDRCNRNNDLGLLLAQAVCRLEETYI